MSNRIFCPFQPFDRLRTPLLLSALILTAGLSAVPVFVPPVCRACLRLPVRARTQTGAPHRQAGTGTRTGRLAQAGLLLAQGNTSINAAVRIKHVAFRLTAYSAGLAAGLDHLAYLPLVTTTGADAATPACPSPTPTPTPTPLPTPDMTARVTWVIDGDTVRLDNGEYLRYIGIDTPELGDEETGEPPECYAEEALWADLRLVKNKPLNIYFDTEQRDRYNRLLAYAYLPDGTFINEWLIRQGYARTFIIAPNTRLARAILDAEAPS